MSNRPAFYKKRTHYTVKIKADNDRILYAVFMPDWDKAGDEDEIQLGLFEGQFNGIIEYNHPNNQRKKKELLRVDNSQ